MDEKISAFFSAIKRGELPVVETFLTDNPALANALDENGLSAVLTAIYYQQPEVTSRLKAAGAVLNLFEAAAAGAADTVQELLDARPELINDFSADGFQPLGLASFFGHAELAALLVERGAEVSAPSRNGLKVQPLHSAAAGQHLEIARLLLQHRADANARQEGGFTPLHSAAQNGQVEMVRLLLDSGADPSLRTQDGQTPRDLALAAGHTQAADLLEP
jgi:uncharacterized protein